VLVVRGLVKEFAAGGHRPTVYRLVRSLLDGGKTSGARMRALDGIDLDVRTGELVGVVGENGAGKTTLLKTIAGLYAPTQGSVEVGGEVALLAGLGVGMIEELSVAENIYLYGAVCRLRRRTIKDRFDTIVQWAELEGCVDDELRTLSSGMRSRLAFGVAMQITSDVILMDEAFNAGDGRFQDRCEEFLRETKGMERTVLVATHNLEFVSSFCDRTLWLHRGRQKAFGPTEVVLPEYRTFVSRRVELTGSEVDQLPGSLRGVQ